MIVRVEVGQTAIITLHDADATPLEPKEDSEAQKIGRPKFGDFQGFKRRQKKPRALREELRGSRNQISKGS